MLACNVLRNEITMSNSTTVSWRAKRPTSQLENNFAYVYGTQMNNEMLTQITFRFNLVSMH